jgi:hypothetical protein
MGRTYLFLCPKCEHCAPVSGGADEGEQFSVQTIHCEECRQLFDAVVKLKTSVRAKDDAEKISAAAEKKPPLLAEALNRLPPRGTRKWLKFQPACPLDPRHRIKPWQAPGRCPRCGATMEQALKFRVWD